MLYIYRLTETGIPEEHINKLIRMFQDVKVSEKLNQEFNAKFTNFEGINSGNYYYIWKI